jgi:hypothetical protein
MADLLVERRGAMKSIDGRKWLTVLDRVLGKDRMAMFLVDALQYRADPEFWDGILKAVGEDWITERQAQADQMVAKLKEAWPDER